MYIKEELITPEKARVLLEFNNGNRTLSQHCLNRYVEDMKAGRWRAETGETIKISKSGYLMDGQHRLTAVIRANVSVRMFICYGVDDDAFEVIDTGKSRTAADIFKIAGVNYNVVVPSVIIHYNAYLSDNPEITRKTKTKSNAELLKQYHNNKEFWDEVVRKSYAWYEAINRIIPVGELGGFYARIKRFNDVIADRFMNELCTGKEVSNNVIYLLRKKLYDDRVSRKKMPSGMRLAFMIKTWNFYVRKKDVKVLKYLEGEEFPKFIG